MSIVYICNADDATDGMGLPLQVPPTEYERTTICKCKPPPTEPTPLPQITVFFKSVSYPASESDGSIIFTIQSSEAFSDEFSVEFSTQNAVPLSAEGKLLKTALYIINALILSQTFNLSSV